MADALCSAVHVIAGQTLILPVMRGRVRLSLELGIVPRDTVTAIMEVRGANQLRPLAPATATVIASNALAPIDPRILAPDVLSGSLPSWVAQILPYESMLHVLDINANHSQVVFTVTAGAGDFTVYLADR